jgi:DNA polymerase-3 subunit gamma/tau
MEDDEAILAEATGMPPERAEHRDPEEIAVELLTAQLGARRLDDK